MSVTVLRDINCLTRPGYKKKFKCFLEKHLKGGQVENVKSIWVSNMCFYQKCYTQKHSQTILIDQDFI